MEKRHKVKECLYVKKPGIETGSPGCVSERERQRGKEREKEIERDCAHVLAQTYACV